MPTSANRLVGGAGSSTSSTVGVGGDAHAPLRLVDRVAEAAELVDELDARVGGERAGEHVAAPDLVDVCLGQLAAFGDRADEPPVHVRQLVGERRALVVGVRPPVRVDVAVRAALVRVGRDAELAQQARLTSNLPVKMPIDPVIVIGSA